MRKVKDIKQAELLLESTREMLKKEMELYNKCKDTELKELYKQNINNFNKTIAELEDVIERNDKNVR